MCREASCRRFHIRRQVTLVVFDPAGARLATAAEDDVVRLWSVSGSQLGQIRHTARVTSISWRPDGVFAATTSADRTAMLSAAERGRHPEAHRTEGAVHRQRVQPERRAARYGGLRWGRTDLARSRRRAAQSHRRPYKPRHGRLVQRGRLMARDGKPRSYRSSLAGCHRRGHHDARRPCGRRCQRRLQPGLERRS